MSNNILQPIPQTLNNYLLQNGDTVLSDTTPAAPSGSSNVTWQFDQFGNISAYSTGGGGSIVIPSTTDLLSGDGIGGVQDSGLAVANVALVSSVPQPGANLPIADGSATAGASALYSRQDHVHPTDTTLAPLASPAFTAVPTAPTAAGGTSTTQIATTAFVQGLLASPTFTGVPAAPTVTATTNTTQLATTAYVQSQRGGTQQASRVAGLTGAGTGPTLNATGVDQAFQLSILTGTTPAASATVVTITFTNARPHTAYPVLFPANAAAMGVTDLFISASSTASFTISIGATALAAATTYLWNVAAA